MTRDEAPAHCDFGDLPVRECWHCDPSPRPRTLEQDDQVDEQPSGYVVAHPVAHQEARAGGLRELATIVGLAAVDLPEDRRHMDVHAMVAELTTATNHVTPFEPDTSTPTTVRHRTTSPSLIGQLESVVAQSSGAESGHRSPGSTPAARLDAIDALRDVRWEAYRWLERLGYEKPREKIPTLAGAVRRVGTHARNDQAITADVRRWWVMCRIVTGWDAPAWKPDNTCPICSSRGDLRVRLDQSTAVCMSCRNIWDEVTIGLLAEHIRAENFDDDDMQ